MKKNKKKGFTLIELLAVLVILVIIMAIATPIILGIIDDAQKSADKADVGMVYDSLENLTALYELKTDEEKLEIDAANNHFEYLDVQANNFKSLSSDNVMDEDGEILVTFDSNGEKNSVTALLGGICYYKDANTEVVELNNPENDCIKAKEELNKKLIDIIYDAALVEREYYMTLSDEEKAEYASVYNYYNKLNLNLTDLHEAPLYEMSSYLNYVLAENEVYVYFDEYFVQAILIDENICYVKDGNGNTANSTEVEYFGVDCASAYHRVDQLDSHEKSVSSYLEFLESVQLVKGVYENATQEEQEALRYNSDAKNLIEGLPTEIYEQTYGSVRYNNLGLIYINYFKDNICFRYNTNTYMSYSYITDSADKCYFIG